MRRTRLLAVGLALAASLGCGSGSKYVPVTGTLKVNDKPAEGAFLTLVPAGGDKDPSARPSAIVNPDGTYEISTYHPETRAVVKGAPPGKYKVIFSWLPLQRPGDPVDPNPTGKAPVDKLGGRYTNPESSKHEVTVNDGPTELAPINLK